jgi:hypothetical protein
MTTNAEFENPSYLTPVAITSFGADDELWVPLDEDGNPLVTACARRIGELDHDAGAEYETCRNAIQLGLEALHCDDVWVSLRALMSVV